jgi:hypothetical protein
MFLLREELEWAFLENQHDYWSDYGSDRPSSGSDTAEDLEEHDTDKLPELPPVLRPARYHNPGTRMQALTMMESGVPHYQVTALTTIHFSGSYKIRRKAISRGYNPEVSRILLDVYVADAPKLGRLLMKQGLVELIEEVSLQNSTTCSCYCGAIAAEVSTRLGVQNALCVKIVYKVLKKKNYKSCKQTVKPGLTDQMKKDRLVWCLEHSDWTDEDWKNVIWTDETSVKLEGIRGKRLKENVENT